MRTCIVTCAMLLVLCTFSMGGQPVSNTEKRQVRASAFDLLSEYENISAFYSENDARSMLRLFGENNSAPVYMDMLGSPYIRKTVTIKQYLDYIKENGIHPFFNMRILSVGEVKKEGQQYRMDVRFQKSISYFDKYETYFSTAEYYGSETILTMTIACGSGGRNCIIERIDGTIDSSTPDLPEKFFGRYFPLHY